MNTSNLLIEEIKTTYHIDSIYGVAKKLHVNQTGIARMIERGGQFSGKTIIKAAKLLNKSPLPIWLKIQSELLEGMEQDLIDADLLSEIPKVANEAESLASIGKNRIADAITRASKGKATAADKKILESLKYILW